MVKKIDFYKMIIFETAEILKIFGVIFQMILRKITKI